LKIAAALLRSGRDDVGGAAEATDAVVDHFSLERSGRATAQQRRALVGSVLAARPAEQPLLELYGATTSISDL
jgi:hypothetical protein